MHAMHMRVNAALHRGRGHYANERPGYKHTENHSEATSSGGQMHGGLSTGTRTAEGTAPKRQGIACLLRPEAV